MAKLISFVLFLHVFTCCTNGMTVYDHRGRSSLNTGITSEDWGEVDGKKVFLYTLTNKNGNSVTISNYGGTITSWIVPDKNGNKSSIIVGFDKLEDYLKKPPYFGATIGRYGNRIGHAQFSLDGKTYKLAANDGQNHLHGGIKGFDKVVGSQCHWKMINPV